METEKESSSSMETSKSDQQPGESKEEASSTDEQSRLWAAVREKPSDFTSWTSLLQMVEQKGELAAAREVFNTFFQYYPYCYGYWKKLADLEKTHAGNDSAKQVYERAVAAVSLSIDMWLHYIKFATSTDAENQEAIRSLYERALSVCGLEYRSSKLWESYLAWEKTNGSPAQLLAIYDRLLAIPTKQLQQHFDNFKKFIEESTISDTLDKEEYTELCTEIGSKEEGELEKALKEKVIEKRSTVFEKTKEEVAKRVKFEDALKRPYFHVKPLERIQLKTWRDYLDFELAQGDQKKIVVLFERCMIACALYEEFWSKFASYAEHQSIDLARSVYSRACTIHLQQKPNIHVTWAQFEEKQGNTEKAREILKNIDSVAPGYVSVRQARVGLELRQRRYVEVEELYRSFLEDSSLTSEARNFYSWRYAKFAARVLGDHNKAVAVIRDAMAKDSSNPLLLYLQLLDLETSRTPPSQSAVEAVFEEVQASGDVNDISKAMFAQRRVAFLEEFGYDISKLVRAKEELARLRSQVGKKRTNVDSSDTTEGEPSKRSKIDSGSATTTSTDQPPTSATTAASTPTTTAVALPTPAVATPTDPQQQQQWAAYQQQWGAYTYGQPGYNYAAQYYSQYPQTYTHTTTQ